MMHETSFFSNKFLQFSKWSQEIVLFYIGSKMIFGFTRLFLDEQAHSSSFAYFVCQFVDWIPLGYLDNISV